VHERCKSELISEKPDFRCQRKLESDALLSLSFGHAQSYVW